MAEARFPGVTFPPHHPPRNLLESKETADTIDTTSQPWPSKISTSSTTMSAKSFTIRRSTQNVLSLPSTT